MDMRRGRSSRRANLANCPIGRCFFALSPCLPWPTGQLAGRLLGRLSPRARRVLETVEQIKAAPMGWRRGGSFRLRAAVQSAAAAAASAAVRPRAR